MPLPVLDTTDAPVDVFRPDGRVFTFGQFGGHYPMPDERVILIGPAGRRRPGRVYSADYGRKLVYVEPER